MLLHCVILILFQQAFAKTSQQPYSNLFMVLTPRPLTFGSRFEKKRNMEKILFLNLTKAI